MLHSLQILTKFSIVLTPYVALQIGMAAGGAVRLRVPARVEMFLFSTASKPALGPIQPHVHWIRGGGLFSLDKATGA
jgi:hypothetical protein